VTKKGNGRTHWFRPCRTTAFAAAAREFGPRLRFGEVDTDAKPELAGSYAIRSIPALIFFKRGVEAARCHQFTFSITDIASAKAVLAAGTPA
jgi:hypothetical protein